MDSALQELRREGDDEDLPTVLRAAATLAEAVRELHAR